MRALALVVALAAASGCKSRTEMVVVVTSDALVVPDDLDTVSIIVRDRGDIVYASPAQPLCVGTARGGCQTLPLVLTLVPGTRAPHDPVDVEVRAERGGTLVIDDAATFSFGDGLSQRLDFILYRACLGVVTCAADPTHGVCQSDRSCGPAPTMPLAGDPPLDAGVPVAGGDMAGQPPQDLANIPGTIALRSVELVQPMSGTSISFTTPSPAEQPGDLMWAVVYYDWPNGLQPTITAPPGWTQFYRQDNSNVGFSTYWYVHSAGSGEPPQFTFSWQVSSLRISGTLLVYGGVDTAMPIDGEMNLAFAGLPYVAPSLTTKVDNARLLAMFVRDYQAPDAWGSPPVGFALQAMTPAIAVYDATQPQPGSTGPVTASATTDHPGAVVFLSLKPR